jgi:hypothetical protein
MGDTMKQDKQSQDKQHQQNQSEDIMKKQQQNPNPNLPRRDDPGHHQQQSGQDKPPNR